MSDKPNIDFTDNWAKWFLTYNLRRSNSRAWNDGSAIKSIYFSYRSLVSSLHISDSLQMTLILVPGAIVLLDSMDTCTQPCKVIHAYIHRYTHTHTHKPTKREKILEYQSSRGTRKHKALSRLEIPLHL